MHLSDRISFEQSNTFQTQATQPILDQTRQTGVRSAPGPRHVLLCFPTRRSLLSRWNFPALCSGGRRPLVAGCLSLRRLGVDLPVTRPVWDWNRRPPASESPSFCQLSCRWHLLNLYTLHVVMLLLSSFAFISIFADLVQLHLHLHTGVCEKNTPCRRAFALQLSGRNCSPAPGLVLCKPVFPRVFLSGGVFFFTDTDISDS